MGQKEKTAPAKGAVVETELVIADIDWTATDEVRAEQDSDAIDLYAKWESDGSEPPPVEVFEGEGRYFAGDGGHRKAAKIANGKKKIGARVTRCKTTEDALKLARLYASGPANARHGVQRTPGDIRKTVQNFIKNFPEYAEESDRRIAEMLHCGKWLVGDVRAKIVNPDHKRPLPPKKSDSNPDPSQNGRAATSEPAQLTNDQLKGLAANNPPSQSWYDEPDQSGGRAATSQASFDRLLDKRGRVVPERLVPAFRFGAAFVTDLRSTLHEVTAGVQTATDEAWGSGLSAILPTVEADLKKVAQDVAANVPFCVCPHVNESGDHQFGGKCKVCVDGRGWLSRHNWHQQPDGVKKLIDELAVDKQEE